MSRTVTIPEDHAGFPGLAHGGLVCGLLADALDSDRVVATFRRPVPTLHALTLEVGETATLLRGQEVLASCERAGPVEAKLAEPVTAAEAKAASAAYPGHRVHPFASCYACGTASAAGLHIFAGHVPGRPAGFVAAPWTIPGAPGEPVPRSVLWAALDCPAIWALMVGAPAGSTTRVVTGRLHAQRLGDVRGGQLCIVTAWPAGAGDGKRFAIAALHDAAGTPLAVQHQTLIEVEGWGVPLSIQG